MRKKKELRVARDYCRPEQIPCAPGYGATRDGRIVKATSAGFVELNLTPTNKYLYASCVDERGKRFNTGVHRLVAMAFHGMPGPGLYACHVNGDPHDNRPENIYWGTPLDNARDTNRHGRRPRGDDHWAHRVPEWRPRGERHGSRTMPHRVATGERHSSRTHPERVPRGDNHWARKHPEKVARGERNAIAKLNDETVRAIRLKLEDGARGVDVAREYGVSTALVSLIRNRRVWAHVA